MNRRQKIIVSVTGIFLVLLLLVGLTYGYFLTRVTGNTKDKSISASTANLAIVYGDGNGIITSDELIMPGTTLDSKTFTVTNNGNDSSYVVIIDNVSVTKASDGSATTFISNDFRYTLSCLVKDKSENVVMTETCNDVESLSIFPMNGGILVGNDMPEDRVHEYTFTLWYIDTGLNQSDDMGKSLQARINITDVAQMENPFKTGVTTTDNVNLAYNIIKNAKENKNGTIFVNTPPTKVAEEISYTKETPKYGYGFYEEAAMDIPILEFEAVLSEVEFSYSNSLETACEGEKGTQSTDLLKKYICIEEQIYYVENSTSESVTLVPFVEGMKIEKIEYEYEKVLSITQDDYGTSYYFRGNVEDNYVNFAGMCWRIVRIAGDGSTKLILEDQYTTCDDTETKTTAAMYTGNWNIGTGNYGYRFKNVDADSSGEYIMDYLNPVTSNTLSMVKAFYDFQTTKLADYTGKLKAGDWCLGDKTYTKSGSSGSYTYAPLEEYNYSSSMYYDANTRLTSGNANGYQPTLKCNGTILDKFATVSGVSNEAPMYVSAITADEIVYAGGKVNESNDNYYLLNNYQKSNNSYFWSLSPKGYFDYADYAFRVHYRGFLDDQLVHVHVYDSFRPSVSLKSGSVIAGGEGTKQKPYVIE